MAHNVASRLGAFIHRLTGRSAREHHPPRDQAPDAAGKASADSGLPGPEGQGNPGRRAQPGGTPAEYERIPGADPSKGRSDLEGGAWQTEATFDDVVPGPPPKADNGEVAVAEDEDVDPIVHRGE